MFYTEIDYIAAKLRGEIVPQEIVDYIEVQTIGQLLPNAIPIYVTRIPAETCEEWLSRMNSQKCPKVHRTVRQVT